LEYREGEKGDECGDCLCMKGVRHVAVRLDNSATVGVGRRDIAPTPREMGDALGDQMTIGRDAGPGRRGSAQGSAFFS